MTNETSGDPVRFCQYYDEVGDGVHSGGIFCRERADAGRVARGRRLEDVEVRSPREQELRDHELVVVEGEQQSRGAARVTRPGQRRLRAEHPLHRLRGWHVLGRAVSTMLLKHPGTALMAVVLLAAKIPVKLIVALPMPRAISLKI